MGAAGCAQKHDRIPQKSDVEAVYTIGMSTREAPTPGRIARVPHVRFKSNMRSLGPGKMIGMRRSGQPRPVGGKERAFGEKGECKIGV